MAFYLKLLFLAILTFWLVRVDWRHKQLPVGGLVLLIGLGLWANPEAISGLVLGITTFVCWRLGYCGSGDVYLLLACGLLTPLAYLPIFCILSGLLIVFLAGFKRDSHTLPLAPPVLLALWTVILL